MMQGKNNKARGLSLREAEVIRNAHFFVSYKDELKSLFAALGKQDVWADDPRQILTYVREKWIGNEHGNSRSKDQFTDQQITAAMPYLARMGFAVEHQPAAGVHYEQAVIVGGMMGANYRRIKLIEDAIEAGAKIDKLVVWLGQRPRDKRDGTDDELLGVSGRFAGESIRRNPWIKNLLRRGLFKQKDKARLTETDLGRFALLKLMGGDLTPYRIDLSVFSTSNRPADLLARIETIPERYVKDYYFRTDDGLEVILLNASSVDRGFDQFGKKRPVRHTTSSCTVEWLDRHAPSLNADILYVTGNPHTVRTAQDTYSILRSKGRADINLYLAGTAPVENTPIQSYLGEIGRLIDNDVRRNYS